MTTTSTHATVEQSLIPVHSEGWRGGLGNLIRKEFGQWWGTRSWWIQTLIWLILLNGVTTMVMLDTAMTPEALVREAVQTFLLVGATAIGIGVVLSIQGAVVGEKELGTAAWVMSKPASRASFVLAKLLANTVGFLVTAVAIPSIVFIVEARYLLTAPVDYTQFALAVAVVALSVVFYVVLTIALGCMFKGRGPVAGIGIGLILVGQFFKGMLPLSLVLVTPWLLGDVASSVALASAPDFNRMVPIIVTAGATVALTFVAVWRFGREEF
ncbi:MAG TPA: ABC transporter permease subunit [Acidimicrobiia bacterium]|nr:ABC transporter permease subunit [Acidimicrobiia bacterium]